MATLLFVAGCGELVRQTEDLQPVRGDTGPVVDPSVSAGGFGSLAVIGSDFVVGSLSLVQPQGMNSNLETTHSDAIVRAYGGLLYVVNRLGQDNLQVIDPARGYKTVAQWSLGRRTNPQDVYVAESGTAFVTLYEPEKNTDPELKAHDIVALDPLDGRRISGIDLTGYTTDDGDRRPRASIMKAVPAEGGAASASGGGTLLCVALQDLPSNLGLPPDTNGKIILIDPAQKLDSPESGVAGTIPLQCRDPVALAYSSEGHRLYVSCADFFSLSTTGGGIEVVDLDRRESRGIWIADEVLGGAPGDLEVSGGFGFVTVGFAEPDSGRFQTKVVRFADHPEIPAVIEEVYTSHGFIQDMAVGADGTLIVGDRWPEVNGLVFIDPVTLKKMHETVTVGLPPSSITVLPQ